MNPEALKAAETSFSEHENMFAAKRLGFLAGWNAKQSSLEEENKRLMELLREVHDDYCINKYMRLDILLNQDDKDKMWKVFAEENNL